MPIVLDGSNGITTPTYGGADTSEYLVPVTQFKNRIINGAMVIDQRNAGASVTITDTGAVTYTLDRWNVYGSAASKFSVQQNAGSVTPPAGFSNYLGVTSLAATSVGSGDYYFVSQYIEGFNTADLNFGTANAKTVTLSFWVRSSLTGTFGGSLTNSANNRSYPFSYTISAANTWEQKSITVAGDTTGTWIGATNGIGLRIYFSIGMGSSNSGTAGAWAGADYRSATGATSVVGTNGATFYLTGVQLEVGSTATSFDYRPYGTELLLCMRYYYKLKLSDYSAVNGFVDGSTAAVFYYQYPVPLRGSATLETTGTASNYGVRYGGGQSTTMTSVPQLIGTASLSTGSIRIQGTVSGGAMNTGYGAGLIDGSASSGTYLGFSAEL